MFGMKGEKMLIAFNLPDKYIYHFNELRERMGLDSMEQFYVHAMGIGVKTIEQAINLTNPIGDNVIQFDPNYLDKKKK
jgi:hypothetical protein